MAANKEIWVFGDWRNFFHNRVTLQLLGKGAELAKQLQAELTVVLFGQRTAEYAWQYICHGADRVLICDHPRLAGYPMDVFVDLMVRLAQDHRPEMILVGATGFGREFAPRVAKRLRTGLTADCIDLELDENGLLIQTAPAFGGNLLARIICPKARPQMATVRPGVFKELPHDDARMGRKIFLPLPEDFPRPKVEELDIEPAPPRGRKLEKARVVVCGGRGVGSKRKFDALARLAGLIGGELAATRPAVHAGWAPEEALVGQAGKHIKPELLISFGVSGAIQHTAGISEAGFIIAVNKNPQAMMMQMADVAIEGDAAQVCQAMVTQFKERLKSPRIL